MKLDVTLLELWWLLYTYLDPDPVLSTSPIPVKYEFFFCILVFMEEVHSLVCHETNCVCTDCFQVISFTNGTHIAQKSIVIVHLFIRPHKLCAVFNRTAMFFCNTCSRLDIQQNSNALLLYTFKVRHSTEQQHSSGIQFQD